MLKHVEVFYWLVFSYDFMQESAMKRGIDILVGTPGRILDHMNRGNLNLTVSVFYGFNRRLQSVLCP